MCLLSGAAADWRTQADCIPRRYEGNFALAACAFAAVRMQGRRRVVDALARLCVCVDGRRGGGGRRAGGGTVPICSSGHGAVCRGIRLGVGLALRYWAPRPAPKGSDLLRSCLAGCVTRLFSDAIDATLQGMR